MYYFKFDDFGRLVPMLDIVRHYSGEFNVANSDYLLKDVFLSKQILEEYPLGPLNASVYFDDKITPGKCRTILRIDNNPLTKNRACILGSEGKIEITNVIMGQDKCPNAKKFMEYGDIDYKDGVFVCRYCGARLISQKHPYYNRFIDNPNENRMYHAVDGKVKDYLIIADYKRVDDVKKNNVKVLTRLGIILEPEDGEIILSDADFSLYKVSFDGNLLHQEKMFAGKHVTLRKVSV